MGHAGAIFSGSAGGAQATKDALEVAGWGYLRCPQGMGERRAHPAEMARLVRDHLAHRSPHPGGPAGHAE
ncbi:hypothetical protein ACTPOK_06890 [Streptomyces inhibens]|uniref:hypothetical protein n=1 Tax=Streptomyces inhibens TaxID=2293571 RepID=UPI00402A74C9